ncbi:MAG: GTP pyrophosphokinase family protein [Dehalococcoidia bacterium]|nr:GTP pyrophosphokinase family protein [Dehalococcoidia bacterium]
MAISKERIVNIPALHEDYAFAEVSRKYPEMMESFAQFLELRHLYDAAIREIITKLEILDTEFQLKFRHNPIYSIESRLKSPNSIFQKLKRRGLSLNLKSAQESLYDIAGIRVICNYIDDLYTVESLLLRQTDIELVEQKDYVKNPKRNGYRSLHIVVTVPVFLSDKTVPTPVEIQLRTIAMDYWASLEHKLRYKSKPEQVENYGAQLSDCADKLAGIEQTMQEIHRNIGS